MNPSELLAAARDGGLRHLDVIATLARPAAHLVPADPTGGQALVATRSRIGGAPALPAGIDWPRYEGRPMSFIAQVDLATLPASLVDDGFPSEGLLLFFCDTVRGAWVSDFNDAGGFIVIHLPDAGSVADAAWPADLPEAARFHPVALYAEETTLLPASDAVIVEDLGWSQEQEEAYSELLGRLEEQSSAEERRVSAAMKAWARQVQQERPVAKPGSWLTRAFARFSGARAPWAGRAAFERVLVGGYPDQIQNDMALDCALITGRMPLADGAAREDPRLPAVRQEAREWRLLLQVPGAPPTGMSWGDCGCLYYWIREEDLRARRFGRAWIITQCF